ncbi:MAG: cupin fold metalloprotein, WbuC family [Deltaproteobacteria bacterium HGW-Deltaproteobacteria-6]|jgi:cupin fold WbuC family metalloprotein|nr:MAG: cupin fold metalloprotein, WbuC family [Deltaproteobacteria bacterium HGW-Deltaproteobacteria-6]
MKLVTNRMMDEWIAKAGEILRLRTNFNIHESLSDPVQRLFVAAGLNSYFRPHVHPGKSEFVIVLRGLFDILLFDDEGVVTERVSIGPEGQAFAMEIPADRCHAWIPMEEKSVFFEVKQGPYDPATSLIFAPWSPEEGSARVKEFQARLLAAQTGDRVS